MIMPRKKKKLLDKFTTKDIVFMATIIFFLTFLEMARIAGDARLNKRIDTLESNQRVLLNNYFFHRHRTVDGSIFYRRKTNENYWRI